jgi:hypothetical protein
MILLRRIGLFIWGSVGSNLRHCSPMSMIWASDIKEISFSLKLDHDITGLSVYIDKRDLNELSSSIEWLSTSILFLWCA